VLEAQEAPTWGLAVLCYDHWMRGRDTGAGKAPGWSPSTSQDGAWRSQGCNHSMRGEDAETNGRGPWRCTATRQTGTPRGIVGTVAHAGDPQEQSLAVAPGTVPSTRSQGGAALPDQPCCGRLGTRRDEHPEWVRVLVAAICERSETWSLGWLLRCFVASLLHGFIGRDGRRTTLHVISPHQPPQDLLQPSFRPGGGELCRLARRFRPTFTRSVFPFLRSAERCLLAVGATEDVVPVRCLGQEADCETARSLRITRHGKDSR